MPRSLTRRDLLLGAASAAALLTAGCAPAARDAAAPPPPRPVVAPNAIPAPPPVPTGLDVLRTALAAATTAPCPVVFAGSSTTAGAAASRPALCYVDRTVAALQRAHPSGTGSEAAVLASPEARWAPTGPATGVHGYNAGRSGSTAASYLPEAVLGRLAAVAPVAVVHMVGSNDFHAGTAPETYRDRLESRLAALRAALPGPCVHVLVHSYERMDPARAPRASWRDFGTVLTGVAARAPADVVAVDLSDEYRALGVPGADPGRLLHRDRVHQTDAGHAVMAHLVARALLADGPGRPASA
ncbi:SGNH/GDSL hydrolase family protein [Trujillonella humicola]|uniref:SGNH/GDSL hydrolase family protein n=1 Tax=Trujillonella humicola TaxID=3383699 RepID=UPI003906BFBA